MYQNVAPDSYDRATSILHFSFLGYESSYLIKLLAHVKHAQFVWKSQPLRGPGMEK